MCEGQASLQLRPAGQIGVTQVLQLEVLPILPTGKAFKDEIDGLGSLSRCASSKSDLRRKTADRLAIERGENEGMTVRESWTTV